MIRFNAGFVRQREAHLIGLGLTETNLILLMQGKPIHITSEGLEIPKPGFDIAIFAAADVEGIKRRGLELIEAQISPEDKARYEQEDIRIPCMFMEQSYYLFPLVSGNRGFYLVGLDNSSLKILRGGYLPVFRIRDPLGQRTNVEVIIFWGADQEVMEESFYASGLISRTTKVRKLPDDQVL